MASKWLAAGLVAAAAVAQVAAAPGDVGTTIAGYKFVADVSDHARIDLDVKDVENAKTKYAAAKNVYTKGKNSNKSSGKRTLQGFSTKYSKPGPARTEPLAAMSKIFWGDWDYANKHILAAMDGKNSKKYGMYGSGALAKTSDARQQIIKKVIKFSLIAQYVQHEMFEALSDYKKGEGVSAAKHWDETWAFYAGSQEKGSGSGFSTYILAEKRSKNFGTRSGGKSVVNKRFLSAMNKGKGQVKGKGQAAALTKTIKCIRGLMAVPAIQGCLRYSYKVSDPSVSSDAALSKESAEAWAFCAAALPGLASVDRAAAARVRTQTFLSGTKRVNWPIVRDAFGAKNLNKMGLRCADVGALNTEYPKSQHRVCKDGKVSNNNQGTQFC